jgi:hypothetical protein
MVRCSPKGLLFMPTIHNKIFSDTHYNSEPISITLDSDILNPTLKDTIMFDLIVVNPDKEITLLEAAMEAAERVLAEGTTDLDAHLASIEFLNEFTVEVAFDDGFDKAWKAHRVVITDFDINDLSGMEVW